MFDPPWRAAPRGARCLAAPGPCRLHFAAIGLACALALPWSLAEAAAPAPAARPPMRQRCGAPRMPGSPAYSPRASDPGGGTSTLGRAPAAKGRPATAAAPAPQPAPRRAPAANRACRTDARRRRPRPPGPPAPSALLHAIAWQESRFRHAARNSRSSASGLMQFTSATWLEVVRDHGAKHGLAAEAAALSTDPRTGTISARNHRILARILKLRFNPRLSAIMAAERLAAAEASLEQADRPSAGAGRPLCPAPAGPDRRPPLPDGAGPHAIPPRGRGGRGGQPGRQSGPVPGPRQRPEAEPAGGPRPIGRLVAGPPIELAEAP